MPVQKLKIEPERLLASTARMALPGFRSCPLCVSTTLFSILHSKKDRTLAKLYNHADNCLQPLLSKLIATVSCAECSMLGKQALELISKIGLNEWVGRESFVDFTRSFNSD